MIHFSKSDEETNSDDLRRSIFTANFGSTVPLKVTYHENLTFPGAKCYNQVPGASSNQGNVKKINPVTLF